MFKAELSCTSSPQKMQGPDPSCSHTMRPQCVQLLMSLCLAARQSHLYRPETPNDCYHLNLSQLRSIQPGSLATAFDSPASLNRGTNLVFLCVAPLALIVADSSDIENCQSIKDNYIVISTTCKMTRVTALSVLGAPGCPAGHPLLGHLLPDCSPQQASLSFFLSVSFSFSNLSTFFRF